MSPLTLSPRLRRILALAVGLVIVFTGVGFLVLPPIVKAQMEKRLSAELGRTVTVGKVRINPYQLSASFEDFAIREADGKSPFLGWRRLYVNFEALASLRGSWVLGEIALDGLQVVVQVRPDGTLNFSDLLAKFTAPPAAASKSPPRPLRIGRLDLVQAQVQFTDQSRPKPFATVLGPMTFSVTELHTSGENNAPYRFEAVTEVGERLSWSGTIQAAPFHSIGELRLENIPLAKYAPYHAEFMQADLAEGKLSVHGRYELDLAERTRVLKLAGGTLQVRGLKVLERASQETAIELAALDVTGIQADALTQKAAVGAITLRGGHLRVRREKGGAINLVSMFQPPPGKAAPAPATAAPPSAASARLPDVTVGELAVKDFKIDLNDLAAPRPARLGLGGIEFSLKAITLADGASMPLQLAFDWAPRGTVRVAGTVAIKPELKANLQTEVANLEILPLSPYLEQFITARVTQGAISTINSVQFAMADRVPAVTFAGSVRVEKFGLVDGAHNQDLAGLAALTIDGIKISTRPQLTVSVAEINVAGPYARVVVNPDKSLNLAAIAPPPASAGPATPPAAGVPVTAPAGLPRIAIGKVVFSAGDFSFADGSVQPPVRTTLGQFGGTIAGLSSENMTKADVALQGVVDGAGPVSIKGRLDPLGATKFVDLTVDFKNVDLVPFSPYSGRFAGFELARGKLGVDVRFQLEGSKIEATNVVNLDKLTFGAPVESPDATKLPVRLGVALLKDLDGRIVIDIPIQGRLDDPEFKIGRVVVRVLVNLLTKAAVSPFMLLGSMFGGGGDELAFQEFAPGSSALLPAEIGKLATMIKALTNRPALSVALEGGYDTAADAHALKRVKVAGMVRRAVWEAKHAVDPNIPPPEQLVITPAEEVAMTKTLFDRKFPPGTEFGTPLPAAPAVVKPPEPPAGFFKRVVSAVTGRGKREQLADQKENERLAAEHQQALKQAVTSGRPMEEMLGRLAEATEVKRDDLAALAEARAQRVRNHFITQGQIAADRLFLAKANEATQGSKGPRVFLSLQ
jgi:hypothetical protein